VATIACTPIAKVVSNRDGNDKPIKMSTREIEVLTLVAQGKSSRAIADEQFVSKRTVDFHLGNIFLKLRVTNRIQAVRSAIRLGFIPGELQLAD
jgi:DNA-binding NarL/FixJ family response regulator